MAQRARALIQIWLSNTYVVSLSCSLQDVKIKLAQAYGYCWGVERAVQMAYEPGSNTQEHHFMSQMRSSTTQQSIRSAA